MTAERPVTPVFSIVTPVYDPPIEVLAETIQSAIDQTFDAWELILVDDCSPNPAVRDTLRRFAAQDPRVRVIERAENGHIVAASNDGIAAARGEFIALLDHDDLLVPEALEIVHRVVQKYEDLDYVYSDEDKIDAEGHHYQAFAKPAWSPERLRGQNYCCHFSVLRTSLVREVGGFREGYDGSQDHDIILRVSERARRVIHIPRVLYHWRVVPGSAAGDPTAKPYAVEAGRRAVQDQLKRLDLPGRVELGHGRGHYRIHHELVLNRLTSVVIAGDATRRLVWGEYRDLLTEAVRSARVHTGHEQLEFVIVHDETFDEADWARKARVEGALVRFVRCESSYRLSQRLNAGALASTGDRLVFLSQATEIRTSHWLEELVGPLEEETVGLTGPKTLWTDGQVASCGLARHPQGYVNVGKGVGHNQPGEFGMLWSNHEVSALGPACVAIRREDFLAVGGFGEQVHDSLIHLDLALKVRRQRLRAVAIVTCEIFHFEPPRRFVPIDGPGLGSLKARWGVKPADPYVRSYRGLRARQPAKGREELSGSAVRARVSR